MGCFACDTDAMILDLLLEIESFLGIDPQRHEIRLCRPAARPSSCYSAYESVFSLAPEVLALTLERESKWRRACSSLSEFCGDGQGENGGDTTEARQNRIRESRKRTRGKEWPGDAIRVVRKSRRWE